MCRREEHAKSIQEDKRRLEKAKKRLAGIPALTTTIVNAFIKQIIVYAPEKAHGK